MRKPNLFIVGAPKSGTTSMREWLNQHQDIWMNLSMEPNFFASDVKKGSKFNKNEKAYISLFQNAGKQRYIGDKSPLCLFSNQAARRIKAFSPGAKIIIMLRDPAEMIYSLHNHFCWDGEEKIHDFEKAINSDPFYKEIGKYFLQVKRYLEQFGKKNIHIIIFDDLKSKPDETYRATLNFLNLDYKKPDFKIYNPAKSIKNQPLTKTISNLKKSPLKNLFKRVIPVSVRTKIRRLAAQEVTDPAKKKKLPEKLKKHLSDYFSSDLKKLEFLINRDLKRLNWYSD